MSSRRVSKAIALRARGGFRPVTVEAEPGLDGYRSTEAERMVHRMLLLHADEARWTSPNARYRDHEVKLDDNIYWIDSKSAWVQRRASGGADLLEGLIGFSPVDWAAMRRRGHDTSLDAVALVGLDKYGPRYREDAAGRVLMVPPDSNDLFLWLVPAAVLAKNDRRTCDGASVVPAAVLRPFLVNRVRPLTRTRLKIILNAFGHVAPPSAAPLGDSVADAAAGAAA